MKYALKTLSLAVATLLAHGHAAAATPSSEELASVKLYGNVTIAQDSVNNWGPWEQFEAPAAGPVALTPPSFSLEFFRTLPKVKEDGLNQELAGFGTFAVIEQNENAEGGFQWHNIELTGTAFNQPAPGSLSPQGLQLLTTTVDESTHLMPDSGKLVQTGDTYSGINAQGHLTSLALIPSDVDSEKAQASFYQRQIITDYITDTEGNINDVLRGSIEVGVIGYKTATSDMSALRANNFQANYVGQSLSLAAGFQSMSMSVNFGNSTWHGNFDAAGGISASGSVSGNSFNASSINAGESSAQGYIRGNFTGPMAAGLMGNLDVTANGGRTQASFLAQQATQQQETAAKVQPK